MAFVFFTLRLLDLIGHGFPLRELIVSLMLVQLVVCPIIIYNYFDNEVMYAMELDESVYINFVIVFVAAFIFGLFFKLPQKNNKTIKEIVNEINECKIENSKIGLALTVIGFLALFLTKYVPPSLSFLLYLLGHLRFIGVFYLLFSNNSFKLGWLLLVFGIFAYETVGSGIFINLFTWTLLLFLILGFRYHFSLITKTGIFVLGVFLAFFIQSFKTEYREIIWSDPNPIYEQKYKSKQDAFVGKATEKVQESDELYEYSNLNRFISRLNQGMILTKVLNHVPLREPFANGETIKSDLYASIVPRFLDPSKTIAGGKAGAEKFTRFTGKQLVRGTRMTIGVVGDAYVNFGIVGGALFMLCFGLLLNFGINIMIRFTGSYPSLLLWIPFVFALSMRAGNEFVAILNYITKSAFLVFLVFWFFNKYFKVARR